MTDRKGNRPLAKSADGFFGLTLAGWLGSDGRGQSDGKGGKGPEGRAVFVGASANVEKALAKADVELGSWQLERALKRRGEVQAVPSAAGPVWLLLPQTRVKGPGAPVSSHLGLLEPSSYGAARDIAGALGALISDFNLSQLTVSFIDAEADERAGALVGLEMGAYKFRGVRQPKAGLTPPRLVLAGVTAGEVATAATLATSINMARHLVNLPAGDLNPATYSAAVSHLFKSSSTMKVDVWNVKELEKERLGLLLAVGKGATHPPTLVHLKYRPKGKVRGQKPLAFVGKGVTFDTGGLDIKDAGSMRMMKKDMGGAASLTGLAYWVDQVGMDVSCDFYLALAENAVDQDAFHPGDILTSRNGQTVEIDNTDAEGRLVLADAIDVAITAKGKDEPGALIDLATLTGAMRVALGTRLSGMFANDDGLAEAFLRSAQRRGDPAWRMPLYGEYMNHLKSVVADVANSGPNRFGGAISAALFLSRFVGALPWIHVDMYAWTDGGGGCGEPGGNGQCVQTLADFLAGYRG